jgi:hypothetical protein
MFLLLRSTILEATYRPVGHGSEAEPGNKAKANIYYISPGSGKLL